MPLLNSTCDFLEHVPGQKLSCWKCCRSSESTHWSHQVSSAAQANPNGCIMDRNDSTAHCHIKNCSFLTYGCMCMCVCVCVFLTELQCLCAGAVTGEGKPGQPHSTLLSREGPAQVPWGRMSPTVPQHPPRVVAGRVPWPQGVRGMWVPWRSSGSSWFLTLLWSHWSCQGNSSCLRISECSLWGPHTCACWSDPQKGGVDASTLPCHQQLPVPPSSVWLCC